MRDPTTEPPKDGEQPPAEERKEGDVDPAKAENSDDEPQSQDPIARYTEPKYYYVHLKVSAIAADMWVIYTKFVKVETGNGSLPL